VGLLNKNRFDLGRSGFLSCFYALCDYAFWVPCAIFTI